MDKANHGRPNPFLSSVFFFNILMEIVLGIRQIVGALIDLFPQIFALVMEDFPREFDEYFPRDKANRIMGVLTDHFPQLFNISTEIFQALGRFL